MVEGEHQPGPLGCAAIAAHPQAESPMIAPEPGGPAFAIGAGRPPHERAVGEKPELVRRARRHQRLEHLPVVLVLEFLVGRAPSGLRWALAEAGDEIRGQGHGVGFEARI